MAKKKKLVTNAAAVEKTRRSSSSQKSPTAKSVSAKTATAKRRTASTKKTKPRTRQSALGASSNPDVELKAEEVLRLRFITYTAPLELARRWLYSDEGDKKVQACKLLEGLFRKFNHSLEIGHQLALAYLEVRDEAACKRILDQLLLSCRNPNEEVLSRCGRLSRDRGDRYVKYPEVGGSTESPRDALQFYRRALDEYTEAYKIRCGHYPGVNVATLHLLIAALEEEGSVRAKHLKECQDVAKALLSQRNSWPDEAPDDAIWHSATEGELHLLLKQWDAAANCYRVAQQHKEFASFHRTSMRKQVIRILYCYEKLKEQDIGPFKQLDTVFPPR